MSQAQEGERRTICEGKILDALNTIGGTGALKELSKINGLGTHTMANYAKSLVDQGRLYAERGYGKTAVYSLKPFEAKKTKADMEIPVGLNNRVNKITLPEMPHIINTQDQIPAWKRDMPENIEAGRQAPNDAVIVGGSLPCLGR